MELTLQPKRPSLARDFVQTMQSWRKWYLIGLQSVRSRYARSRLGQFWISISYLISVVALSLVYNHLWKIDLSVYLPYLAMGQIFWAIINSVVLEGCNTFISSSNYMQAEEQPKGIFCMIVIWRQFVYFLHNLVVLIGLMLVMQVKFSLISLLAIPGFILLLINSYWICMLLGMASARFRDLPSMFTSLMQVIFFIVPVMWMPTTITSPRMSFWLVEANPFAALLAVVRDPLLGTIPTAFQYANILSVTVLGLLVTSLVFRRFSTRITYWL